MFTKWSKRESFRALICFAVFFAGVLATQLPGYLSPLYWAVYPVFAAFVAAGAMIYVVVEELIPEMAEGEHSHIGVLLFAPGFTVMMALDVALG